MTRAKDMSDFGPSASAGAVLQMVQNEVTDETDLSTSYANLWENSITLKSSSSNLIINLGWHYWMNNSAGFGAKIYRNTSATVTTSHTAVWTKNERNSTGPYTWYNGSSGSRESVATIIAKDSLSGLSAGTTIYYGAFYRKYDSDNVTIGGDADTENGFLYICMTEVQT